MGRSLRIPLVFLAAVLVSAVLAVGIVIGDRDGRALAAGDSACSDYDRTGDGLVRVADILFIVDLFGTDDPLADLDKDGFVRVSDILVMVQHFACDLSG